jgi:sugar porter (SP) family MFS transporter
VATVPYLNEIAPVEFRGRLSSMFELMIVVGALLGSVSSLVLSHVDYGWRVMFFVPSLLGMLQIIGMMSLPESPHWLVQQGKLEEAKLALAAVYVENEAEVQRALDHIIEVDTHSRVPSEESMSITKDFWAEVSYIHPHSKEEMLKYMPSFVVIIILMALGQLTGSVVIRNYAPTIFKDAGFSRIASLEFNCVVSLVNLAVVCTSTFYVDRFGRRLLLGIGFFVTAVGMAVLIIGFLTTNQDSTSSKDIVTFLCGCILTSAGFVLGFGPVGWVLSSELFSTKIRGRALSISTLSRNIFEFCTNFLFLTMIKQLHDYGTFAVFFLFCILSMLFVMFGLVETKEIEAEEILASLRTAPLWQCCFGGRRGRNSKLFNLSHSGETDTHKIGNDEHSLVEPVYSPVSSGDKVRF